LFTNPDESANDRGSGGGGLIIRGNNYTIEINQQRNDSEN
jgi:hypothetical protein